MLRTSPRATLPVLLTAGFTLAVDFSVLNVALPVIGRDIGLETADLQWIATSYALCAAGLTLFFGRVCDLLGRRRIFLLGMVLLGVSSLAGGLAQTAFVLLAARAAQGVATAMVTPAALSLLTTGFPEGPARDRALGLNGALMAGGFTTGAMLGGLLTDTLSWRWAFFLNVIVAVAVLAVAPRVLPKDQIRSAGVRLDLPGALLATGALVALVLGASSAGESGWTATPTWTALVTAGVLCLLFLWIESRSAQPLIALAMLRRRPTAVGNLAGALAFAAETSLVFLLTLYLQDVLGISALAAGAVFGVLGVGTVLGGLLAPRIFARVGLRRGLTFGFVVQGAATLPLVFAGPDRAWVIPLLLLVFVGGVANLVAIVGYVTTATSGLPDHEQGLATGLVTMSQQVGITLGTPVLSAVVVAGASVELLNGLHLAIAVNAGVCLAAALLVRLGLRA
ncbi:MFS transporter [Kineosporia rhizophila]|uniref:MFS transporter n=1 Tax=Kineosporia TaxID=49184 RepID=UPI001E4F1D40|nr:MULTISPECIES: MFS transporter [Kineosporia]MCE0539323.1 MFS transporter [Kineosporia rhizophila]GLY19926.1 MFS transporter [Kineosporia sp. NBRC 101677]